MHAVILAAGDGGRLHAHTRAMPKPLVPLLGRPIVAHLLEALHAAGVTDATIVVGYRGEQVRAALGDVTRSGVCLRYVCNDRYAEGNARSLWAARESVAGPFVLAMADHVVEPSLVRSLIERADGRCLLAVETAVAGDSRAAEATRARVTDGRVVALGKSLADWNALDTGLFWCTPHLFDAMTPGARDGEVGAVFAGLAKAGELDAVDVTGSRWIDIDTVDDLRRAESLFAVHDRPS